MQRLDGTAYFLPEVALGKSFGFQYFPVELVEVIAGGSGFIERTGRQQAHHKGGSTVFRRTEGIKNGVGSGLLHAG